MRFAVYLATCASLLATTQAAGIHSATEVHVGLDVPAEAGATIGTYLELDSAALAEAEAYIEAGVRAGAESVAHAQALAAWNEMLAEVYSEAEGDNESDEEAGQLAQVDASAEDPITIGTALLLSGHLAMKTAEVGSGIAAFYKAAEYSAKRWAPDTAKRFGQMI